MLMAGAPPTSPLRMPRVGAASPACSLDRLHELDMALLIGPQRQFQLHDLAIEDAGHAHGHVWHDGRSRHHGRFGGTRTDRDRYVSRNDSEDSPKVDQLARSIPVGPIGQPDDVT